MNMPKRLYGPYRAVVISTKDPLGRGRIQAQIPQVFGNGVTGWIPAKQTAGLPTVIPNQGAGVWVEFEGGDPSYPLWTGTFGMPDARVIVLNDLSDVTVPSPLNNALLTYDSAGDEWFARNRVESADYVGITTAPTAAVARATGRLWWDSDNLTLNAGVGTESVLQLGQELQMIVQNDSGSPILHGTLVMGEVDEFGRLQTVGQGIIRVVKAVTDGSFPSKLMLGVATEDIPNGSRGLITEFGYVNSLNTSAPGWALGDVLWNNPAVPGGLTNVEPSAPNLKLPVAVVTRLQTNNGSIYVRMTQGSSLGGTDDNVQFVTPVTNGQVLTYDATLGVWTNEDPSGGASALDDLTDVAVSSPANNHILRYDTATGDWVNSTLESILPAIAINDTFVVASESAMLSLSAQKGDVAIRTDVNKTFILADSPATTLSNWKEILTPADGVTSVNGDAGPTVVLDAADIGAAPASHTHALDDLSDVSVATVVDGQVLRYNGTSSVWEADSSSSVIISDTAPASPTEGDLWFDSTDGTTYIYYNDGDSAQWVGFGGGSSGYVLGTIYPWAVDAVPSWALELNGQAVSRTTYSGLFALLGTTYGSGDGSTTFNLPNYRGRTLVGQDTAQTEFNVLGETGGAKTHTLTVAEMPSHTHTQTAHGHAFRGGSHTILWGQASNVWFNNALATAGSPPGNQAMTQQNTWNATDDATATNQNTGGGGAHNNLQPYTVVKWIICAATSAGDFDTEVQTALVTRVSDTPLSQNFILNGAFDIWQRGTSSLIGSNVYCADRWIQTRSASTTLVVSRSTDVPAGQPLQYSALFSVGSTNTLAQLQQRIESTNAQEIAGKVVTFSIWAKNGLGAASNSTLTWSSDYPTSTNDWTTPISDQSGTFAATFTLGAWVRYSATFTVNALATRGYRIIIRRTQTATETTETYFTGAQLEIGVNVTPFRRNAPNIQAELAACQRYYEKSYDIDTAPGTATAVGLCENYGVSDGVNNMVYNVVYKVTKRANGTVSSWNVAGLANNWQYSRSGVGLTNSATTNTYRQSVQGTNIFYSIGAAWTAGYGNGHWVCDAEL